MDSVLSKKLPYSEIKTDYNLKTYNPSDKYTFNGWYSDISLDSSYKVEDFNFNPDQLTYNFYAEHREWTYTIVIDLGSDNETRKVYKYSELVVLSKITNLDNGYEHTGYETENGNVFELITPYTGESFGVTHDAQEIKLRPVYIQSYTIVFDGNNATGGTMVNQTKIVGETLTFNSNGYIRTGYTLIGWSRQQDGEGTIYKNQLNEDIEYTTGGTITLYAVWKANDYIIIFDSNGGNSVENQEFTINNLPKDFTTGTTPTKEHNVFVGWYNSDGDLVTKITIGLLEYAEFVEELNKYKITLYARWELNNYEVKFDVQGGNLGSISEKLNWTYDTIFTIPSEIPTKVGYTFLGWSTYDNESQYVGGQVLANNELYNAINPEDNTIVLYADWAMTSLIINISDIPSSLLYDLLEHIEISLNDWSTNITISNNSLSIIIYTEYNVDLSSLNNLFDEYALYINDDITYYLNGWTKNLTYMPLDGITYNLEYSANKIIVTLMVGNEMVEYQVTDISPDGTYTLQEENIQQIASNLLNSQVGYHFEEWQLDGTKFDFDKVLTRAITLIAYIKPNSYDVQFNANAPQNETVSGEMEVQQLTYDLPDSLNDNSGYTFLGWSTTPNGDVVYSDGGVVSNLTNTTEPVILYAKWQANTYNIIYNLNGAVGTINNTQITYRGSVVLPTWQRAGYEFLGWSKEINGPVIYDSKVSLTLTLNETGDVYLYAKWEPASYSITFIIPDEYKNLVEAPDQLAVQYYGTINGLEDYEQVKTPGYRFVGWFYNNIQIVEGTVYQYLEDITVIAKFETIKDRYNISFDMNGGILIANQEKAYGSSIYLDSYPERQGYHFDGFVLNGTSDNIYELELQADGTWLIKDYYVTELDVTFKALWTPNSYTIKYVYEDESYTDEFIYDKVDNLRLNEFKADGKHFVNWKDAAGNTYSDGQQVLNLVASGEIVLTAEFANNTYYVEYVANGATSGTMARQEFVYGQEQKLNKNLFEKIGYSFEGWMFNNQIYADEASVLNLVNTNNEVVYLEAIWEANEYTIIFNYDGNTQNEQIVKYDELTPLTTLKAMNLTKTGYEFYGWKYNGKVYADGQNILNLNDSGNITLVADLRAINYIIRYDALDETLVLTYDTPSNITNSIPTKLGYEFEGWSTSNNATSAMYKSGQEVTNILYNEEVRVLYAVWKPNSITIYYEMSGQNFPTSVFNYGDVLPTLERPQISNGLYFSGWYYNGTLVGSGQLITNLLQKEDVENGEIKLTGNILPLTYILSFDTNGANKIDSIEVLYGTSLSDAIQNITKPNKLGYDFDYWSFENDRIDGKTMPSKNITLVANYKLSAPYTITFNSNGGNSIPSATYTVEGHITFPTPNYPGYNFLGWYLGDKLITSTNGYAQNLVLVAMWSEAINYTISYNLDGGTNSKENPTSYTVEKVVEFKDPTKAGYVFDGWYLDADYKNKVIDTDEKVGNLVLHAKWVLEDEYTITYANVDNYDGITRYTVESNVVFKNPTKTGYKFVGWDYEGTYITSTNGLVGDITVTAVWEIITYNINYDLDEGTLASANPSTYNVETATITLNEPEKLGYKFLGWYNGQTKVETIEQGSTGDISLVAKWQVITYTITYDLNDGTNNVANKDSYSVVANITFASPTREGYTFVNWTYNGQEITSTNERFENLVLVANWKVTNYSIVYNLDGGTNSSENPTSYNVEKVVGFKEPTKTGYTFVAWYLDSDYTTEISDTTGYAKDLVLYAKWEINSYKVSFLTGELGINVPEITMNYYETYGSKLPVLEMPYGISFVTWYYETTDGEVVNITKDSIFNLTTDITLKAQYTTTAFNIVYETNGGINHSSNVTTVTALAMAEKPLVLLAPSKTGYSFVGWYLDSSFGGEAVVEISPAILANSTNGILTLYAKYEVSRYTITYQDIDGTVIKTVNNVAYNSLAELFTPTKDGYIFDAWYLNGAKYDFNTPVTGNLTLVAMYRIMEVSTETVMNNETVKVVVTSVDGKGLPADAHIVIELVVEEESNNQVADLLQEYGQVSRFYDIKLVDAKGNEIAPSSEVRVTLSLPNEEITVDKTYSIVNIKDDLSDWQEIESYLKDGNLEFFTTHFSYYAIVVTDKAIDFTWLWIVLGVAGFLLVQVIIIVIIKTRRFKIRFVSKGNVKVKEIKYRKNMSVTLPTPSRIGYKFVGWYLDQEFKYPANIKTMPNENLILYARWIEDPLTIGLKVKKAK